MPEEKVNLDSKPLEPAQHFQQWLAENNYVASLTNPVVRVVDGGGVLIEQPQLLIGPKPAAQPSSIK